MILGRKQVVNGPILENSPFDVFGAVHVKGRSPNHSAAVPQRAIAFLKSGVNGVNVLEHIETENCRERRITESQGSRVLVPNTPEISFPKGNRIPKILGPDQAGILAL